MEKYREPRLLDVVGCPCGHCGKTNARMYKPEWVVLGARVNSSPSDHYVASVCISCRAVMENQPESFALPMFDQCWKNTLEWLMVNGYFKFHYKATIQ